MHKTAFYFFTETIMMFLATILVATSIIPTNAATNSGNGTVDDLELMFQRMEQDVKLFKRKMESLLLPQSKCSSQVMEKCSMANFDGCASSLPVPTCPGGSEFASQVCGDGTKCGAIYDFNATTLRLAPGSYNLADLEPSDSVVKDAVCYSLLSESYLFNYTDQSRDFWKKYAVSPPSMYYGSDSGVFRIYPGNPKQCPSNYNTFDPRLRPWYVAAATGPKDVVLVLDTSGSMSAYDRLNILKSASKYVIDTLSVGDYLSVITFNTDAQSLTSSRLQRVRDINRNSIAAQIDSLIANGNTNFYAGFKLAFDTIWQSVNVYEQTAGCQKAILFLTDGENNGEKTGDEVMTYITSEIQRYKNSGRLPPIIFTYSFGTNADESLPKKIACATNGVWSRIDDGGDLIASMTAYYKYFSYGLGDSKNSNFTAWVEPYLFARGNGLGTTVSAPVYDRSVNPPILAGVVGVDMSLAALQIALGEQGEAGINTIIQRLVERSVAYCPLYNFTRCQYESLRYQATVGNEALCSMNCSVSSLNVAVCNQTIYPATVLNNKNAMGMTYEQRSCCNVGSKVNQSSPAVCVGSVQTANNILPIVAGVGAGGGIFLIIALTTVAHVMSKKRRLKATTESNQSGNNGNISHNEIPVATAVLVEPEIPVSSLVPLAIPPLPVIRVK